MKKTALQLIMALAFSTSLSGCGLGWLLKPQTTLENSQSVAPLDYTHLESWAAHPEKPSKALMTPPGGQVNNTTEVAVFFLYPTVWFSRSQWNADFKPGPAQEIVDEISMSNQASSFNGVGPIYAPRYRQTTLGAFYADQAEAQASFEIAYQDIHRAFQEFLKMNGTRPFILAGHSQGSMHLMRLLEEIDKNEDLRQYLVAAYLPGMALPLNWYGKRYTYFKACESPEQNQCIAAWDTYREGASVTGHEPLYYWQGSQLARVSMEQERQCTHPISWKNKGGPSALTEHRGAVEMINAGDDFEFSQLIFSNDPLNVNITGLKAPRSKMVSARCDQGPLRVPNLKDLKYPAMETQAGNYHLLDYELFWADIRHNAQTRVQNWFAQQAQ